VVKQGAFYGWPWYYNGDHEDPRRPNQRPDLKGHVATPDVLIQPHSAPLSIAFYDQDKFPQNYRGDAFITLHGSWNRSNRTGYKVVRMLMKDGKPTGEYADFMTGFVVDDETRLGSPGRCRVAHDGSLIVSEDGSGTVWRVTANRDVAPNLDVLDPLANDGGERCAFALDVLQIAKFDRRPILAEPFEQESGSAIRPATEVARNFAPMMQDDLHTVLRNADETSRNIQRCGNSARSI